jgi:tungstate transport system substrate-binding protein
VNSKLVALLLAFAAIAVVASRLYADVEHQRLIIVSTTASLYQLGVLDDLLSDFKNATGIDAKFKVLVKGSGEALRVLADGSACIAFVHAPSLELQYVEQGKAERLAMFAYNEFVIVGPSDDSADVRNAANAIEAFEKIYLAGEKGMAKFVSRGDMSGTNVRELQLWRLAGLSPERRPWYLKSCQGMVQTLLMAENVGAYSLTDLGTYVRLRNQGRLRVLVELKRDPQHLVNVYSAYVSATCALNDPYVRYVAQKLKNYLMTRGQELLASKYGDVIRPVRGHEDEVERAWEALARLD